MGYFDCLIPSLARDHLDQPQRRYLTSIFDRFRGYPSQEQLWKLMDEQWQAYGCNPLEMDERVNAFYRHPVWLLNGLFIEQDPQSLFYRRAFVDWVQRRSPVRLADFGGGFGTLARHIGIALPASLVEVVEPHPSRAAIALASRTANVRYVPELTGEYDLLIATDVFEHVLDPISLAATTASFLRCGGYYLMANCFAPVIACHLPQLFHLSIGWDQVMWGLGLKPLEKVQYGRAYQRLGTLAEEPARTMEALARRVYPWVKHLPKGRSIAANTLMQTMYCLSGR